jgi:CheY-like chemotaxis protein
MTLRQALTALEDDGFISLEHGRGTFVRSPEGASVLVVDDEPAARSLLREHVAAYGCRVIEASGPGEGLRALETEASIHLILSDIRMPSATDGVHFIRTVHRRWPDIAIAAVTAFPEDLTELHGTPECPVLIITKPFQRQHVERVLDLAMRPQRAEA